jgi:hypothetical protein
MRLLLALQTPGEVRSARVGTAGSAPVRTRKCFARETNRADRTPDLHPLTPPARPCGASVPHLTQEAHAWPSANA